MATGATVSLSTKPEGGRAILEPSSTPRTSETPTPTPTCKVLVCTLQAADHTVSPLSGAVDRPQSQRVARRSRYLPITPSVIHHPPSRKSRMAAPLEFNRQST